MGRLSKEGFGEIFINNGEKIDLAKNLIFILISIKCI